ncbi:HAMP domain-containing histidine kinase [Candidatus Micrarchaeota archaeon]|nr:HAMP domain-containing histidine kinase [Candidatus Micrarchaeota archaeon]
MYISPVLDKVVGDLLKSSAEFPWPKDEPKYRDSWVTAVKRDPAMLRESAITYGEGVACFFYDLENLGNSMSFIREGELPDVLRRVNGGMDAYRHNFKELRRGLERIKAILSVSHPGNISMDDLRGIARSQIIYREGQHDIGNIVPLNYYTPGDIDEKSKGMIFQIGTHLAHVGKGGANVMETDGGLTSECSLRHRFADKLRDFFDSMIEGGLQIEYDGYAGEHVVIKADEGNLYRCFYNLAANAVDKDRGGATRLMISASRRDRYNVIEVADNGKGLPNRKAIFHYGKSGAGGSGLGLFITSQIVEAHGGTITAVGRNNDPTYNGAKFTMRLPVVQKDRIHYPTMF